MIVRGFRHSRRLEITIAANKNEVEFDNNFDSRKFVIKFRNLFVHDADL
ncbi:hypothetical protein BH18THE2_BH18THE2_14720 [soil metagenome]